MPLGAGNILQVVTGTTGSTEPTSTTKTITASATTEGSTLILCLTTNGIEMVPPFGWTELHTQGNNNWHAVWAWQDIAAGVTTWDVQTAAADDNLAWVLYELSGLDVNLLDASASTATGSPASGDWSTGTTAGSAASDTIVIATHAALRNSDEGALGTWSAQTNSFTEDGDTATTMTGATLNNVSIEAAHKFPGTTGSFECTATHSVTPQAFTGIIVVLRGADSPLTDPIVLNTGFEAGTLAGATAGNAGAKFADFIVGTPPTIVTATPHSGTSALRVVAAGAQAHLSWSADTLGGAQHRVHRMWIRIISATGNPQIASSDTPTSGGSVFSYNTATSRIECTTEAGTTVASAATVATNTWFRLEWYANFSGTQYVTKWRLGGVDQTDAFSQTGLTATDLAETYLGTTTADTVTVEYDDVAISTTAGDYPLGDGKSVLLSVDPAGTLAVSGSAASFSTFTNNGTINSTFNVTTARNAIDEVPPTIGATADGFIQDATATADYVQIPMTSYTLGVGEAINALRMLAPGWAVSGTPATLGFRAWDGTTETLLQAGTVDPQFDNSTTSPGWVCAMYLPLGGWTQTNLDALAFRVGFSSDANPDIGIHAIYAEVDIGIGPTERTLADTGSGADTLQGAATVSLADQGASVDSLSVETGTAEVGNLETQWRPGAYETTASASWTAPHDVAGLVLEIAAATAGAPTPKTLADTGTAADTLQVAVTLALAEGAAGQDTLATAATVTLAETGTGADALNVAATAAITLSDSATATDALTVTATVPLAEVGSSADTLTVPASGQKTLAEQGATSDSIAVAAAVQLADSGQAADTAQAAAAATLIDTGSAADTLAVFQGATKTLADAGTATDTLRVAATVPLAESGTSADTLEIAATARLADTATASDTLGQGRTFADTATGTDTLRVTVAAGLEELATAADQLAATALVTLLEQAVGSDTLSVFEIPLYIPGRGTSTVHTSATGGSRIERHAVSTTELVGASTGGVQVE